MKRSTTLPSESSSSRAEQGILKETLGKEAERHGQQPSPRNGPALHLETNPSDPKHPHCMVLARLTSHVRAQLVLSFVPKNLIVLVSTPSRVTGPG